MYEIEGRRHDDRERDHEQIGFLRRLVQAVLVAARKLDAPRGCLLSPGSFPDALEEAFEEQGKMILKRSLSCGVKVFTRFLRQLQNS